MNLIAVIVAIETLAAFAPPPMAITSDMMSGIYVASSNEIFHISHDTIAESTSREESELLTGITDIAYSGQWLYVSTPMKGQVLQFDRYLRYRGKVEPEGQFYPEQLAITSDGSLWCFDPLGKRMYSFSSVGDPIENFRLPGTSNFENPVLIGVANWKNILECIPLEDSSQVMQWREIGEVEAPIIWSESTHKIVAGLSQTESVDISDEVANIFLCKNEILHYLVSDKIVPCGLSAIEWDYSMPAEIVINLRETSAELYTIDDEYLIKVKIQWQSQ